MLATTRIIETSSLSLKEEGEDDMMWKRFTMKMLGEYGRKWRLRVKNISL